MAMHIFREQIDSTTTKLVAGWKKIGQVNYPGNEPGKPYHAFGRPDAGVSVDLGHFATNEEADAAIIRWKWAPKEMIGR